MQPSLHVRPLRPAVAADGATTLDLLITVRSPEPPPDRTQQRPALNLALVIDRSGSMHGKKLSYARKAARFLVGELTERDRLALVTFDRDASVLMPSKPVRDPQPFLAAINTIDSGGITALFDGWRAGALQAAEHLDPAALNRVLLLSDGQANRGLTDSGAIADAVAGLSQRGVSTSAFGLGVAFDEDLMGAIASAGDGTLAHIESPAQLADLYASELQGLASTVGRKVSLGIRTSHGAELVDVLNDLPRTPAGNHQLPGLRHGQELDVAVRLRLQPWRSNQPIASLRLAWNPASDAPRQELIEHVCLPVLPAAELEQLPLDQVVVEAFALQEANRARRQAMDELDLGDLEAAQGTLGLMASHLASLPVTERSSRELQLLREKQALLRSDRNRARKGLSREALRSSLDVWSYQPY
jgi:Ca-activated chloride channel homolog